MMTLALSRSPLVIRVAKGPVVGGFESGQDDSPEHIVDGKFVHVGESFAGVTDFQEVVVDNVFGVAVPGHVAANFTGKKHGLHALV
jgi:hypothetical protein